MKGTIAQKLKGARARTRRFFTRRRIIWTIVIIILLLLLAAIVSPKSNAGNIVTETAKREDIRQTVLATGTVTSTTDLSLSFNSSGVLRSLRVKVGEKVSQGQILATLDQKNQAAALTSARGALAAAQARYKKIVDGASSAEVAVAQQAVTSAETTLKNAERKRDATERQQDILVENAYRTLLNSGLSAAPGPTNTAGSSPTVGGTYNSLEEGQYLITLSGNGLFDVHGLEQGNGPVSASPAPLGTRGLTLQFPAGFPASASFQNSWTIDIPNRSASTYVANYNAYQAAVQARDAAMLAEDTAVAATKAALDQRKAELDLKISAALPADVDLAKADILSAQGQVQTAQAAYENTVLRAPAGGTITQIDAKLGELVQAFGQVMILQDVSNLYVEAYINEANISSVRAGQPVDMTFDAFGPDRHFQGTVQQVDPASTVLSGVVNYKITVAVEELLDIRPGMTANMTILIAEKEAVVTAPRRAVVEHDGQAFLRRVTHPKKKTYEEIPVTLGMEGDSGRVEISSGLTEGTEIVTFINAD